jgi:hypothetical protein
VTIVDAGLVTPFFHLKPVEQVDRQWSTGAGRK